MNYPFRNKKLSLNKRLDNLISELTTDEKIGLLSSHQQPVPRLDIGEWYIGTEVARGFVSHTEGEVSTVFPQPIGMAGMFDTDLMKQIGEVAGKEARFYHERKKNGKLMVWGPTVDMCHDIRWGRVEECYGEDPFLTGKMSTAYTEGMCGDDKHYKRVFPALKHFCANSNEAERDRSDSQIPPRVKNEYYYAAFKPAIVNKSAFGVMTAYNDINGLPGMINPDIKNVLKKQWGAQLIVTDGGDFSQNITAHRYSTNHSESLALALKAGNDVMVDDEKLVRTAAKKALKNKLITEKDIDCAIRSSLSGRFQLGEFDDEKIPSGIEKIGNEESLSVVKKAAEECVVLLKNNSVLPLDNKKIKKVAVFGVHASTHFRDWYTGQPEYTVTVKDALEKEFGAENVLFDTGCDTVAFRSERNGKYVGIDGKNCAVANREDISDSCSFRKEDWNGEITLKSISNNKYLTLAECYKAESESQFQWFVRDILKPTGYDGFVTFKSWDNHFVCTDENGIVRTDSSAIAATNHLFREEVVSDGAHRAALLAKKADVAIVCLGNNPLLIARECYDRNNIELPPAQMKLAQAVLKANPNTIIVLISSYPYAINELEKNAPAIIYTPHIGAEQGNAVADALFGRSNPSGKLSVTWHTSLSQMPDIMNYDIINSGATYMYYTGTPLYPFGHGLSYSEFVYSDLNVRENTDSFSVSFGIKNVSERAADESAQVYFRAENPSVKRPIKQLCGFDRIHLGGGESQTVNIEVKKSDMTFWDVSRENFCFEKGSYTFMAGRSSADIRLSLTLNADGETVPPRNLSKSINAVNFDTSDGMLIKYSRTLEEFYLHAKSWQNKTVYKNVSVDGVEKISVKASASAAPGKISFFSADNDKEPLCEINIKAADCCENFHRYTAEIPTTKGSIDIVMLCDDGINVAELKTLS